jgi:hypothetical protein
MLAAVAIATIVSLFALAVRSWKAHRSAKKIGLDNAMESGGGVKDEKDDSVVSSGHIYSGIAMTH